MGRVSRRGKAEKSQKSPIALNGKVQHGRGEQSRAEGAIEIPIQERNCCSSSLRV